MTLAACSLQVFGIYLIVLGVGLVFAQPAAGAVRHSAGGGCGSVCWDWWSGSSVRTPVIAAVALAAYMPTVVPRAFAFVHLSAFALLEVRPPQLALFGVVACSARWDVEGAAC